MRKALSLCIALALVSPVFAQGSGPGGNGDENTKATKNRDTHKHKKKKATTAPNSSTPPASTQPAP
jgi:hypothetical protein